MNASNVASSSTCNIGDETSEKVKKFMNVQTKNSVVLPISRKRTPQDISKFSNKGRKTLETWDHFTLVKDCNLELPRVACNNCNNKYTHPKRNDTSSCWNHLQN